ncbi:fatty acid desaturase [Paraburkholderia sediminicola]|uniref:fatty acid desaturase n=1 Tax=Paraburkholderia sediminicola TaxID=458836 RepID=UPI0038B73E49
MPATSWLHVYARVPGNLSMWAGSVFGHFAGKRLVRYQWLMIVLWWSAYEALLTTIGNTHFALLFFVLWMVARVPVFHAITIFHEMTGHYGLAQRGIFRTTREIPERGLISLLIHPHRHGYHLTHHLIPHIPYFHLHTLHSYLIQIPLFNQRASVCDGYLNGTHASVECWGARHA